MKSKKWILVLLIAAFLLVFWQYRLYDAVHTDTDAPQIKINDTQLLQISVQDPKSALLQGVSAVDEQDGDLTGRLVVESMQLINESGLIEVGYAVADSAGNVAKATREVQYTDYEKPKFSLSRPLVFDEHDSLDIMADVGAEDVLDGDIQHRIRATTLSEDSINNLGTHYVHFQVSNSIGDTSELIVPVEVQKSDRFDADLTLTDYLIYLPVGAAFQPNAYLENFIHRDEITYLGNGLPKDFSVKVTGSVNTDVAAVYTLEYRVTYTVRHQTNPDYDQKFTGYSKLIVVVEG